MPPRGVRKQSANQHNHRHENGLAQPGKKIEKQRGLHKSTKTNGHLNGGYNPPASPPAGRRAMAAARPISGESSSEGSSSENRLEYDDGGSERVADEPGRRESESSDYIDEAFQNGTDSPSLGGSTDYDQETHRRIDVNASSDTAGQDSQTRGAMAVLSTILWSCPLGDSISVLIILLQIPPAVLTIVNFLFATLTLIPQYIPTIAALPSPRTVLSSSVGNPSLGTIVTADVVFMIFWLFLWAPAQDFTVDFAQAIIAVSLGSGYRGKGGSTRNVFLCLGVIMACHFAKRKGFRLSALNIFSSIQSAPAPTSTTVASFIAQPESSITSRSSQSLVRSILAVHITTQGIVRSVRGWLMARDEDSPTTPLKKTDPDAVASTASQIADGKAASESSKDGAGGSVDDKHVLTTANTKIGKEKPQSNNKKKRKKPAKVRSTQPIWSSLASIKVTAMNSYEQSEAAAKATDAKATDMNNLGNATFISHECAIWITHVGRTDLCFSTSLSALQKDHGHGQRSGPSNHVSYPILVNVNGTSWTSVSITPPADDSGSLKSAPSLGQVFGLAPSSNYRCDFMSSEDQAVIFSTTFTTQRASSSLTAHSNPAAPIGQNPLRPSSPTTTLKNSITTAAATLQDEKTIQRRTRKDHKTNFNGLRKEVDSSSSRLSGSSGGDDRSRQRVLQLRQNIRQAKDVIGDTSSEIDTLGSIPEEDSATWKEAENVLEAQHQELSVVEDHQKDEKSNTDRQVTTVDSEALTATQKRERLQTRLNKLQEQHDRIANAEAQGLSSKEQRAAEQAAISRQRQAWEQSLMIELGSLQAMIKQTTSVSQGLWQQIHSIETSVREQQQQQQLHPSILEAPSSPIEDSLPEGDLPGTTHLAPSSPTAAHDTRLSGQSPFPANQAPLSGFAGSSLGAHHSSPFFTRGRSGSLLSTSSGPPKDTAGSGGDLGSPSSNPTSAAFQLQQQQQQPPVGSNRASRRISQYSDEGGSSPSSASGSGSQRDPMSPTVKRGSPLSTGSVGKSKPPPTQTHPFG